MTADIRAAALAEARSAGTHHELSSVHYTRVFTAGAAWAAERVTPAREQVAEAFWTATPMGKVFTWEAMPDKDKEHWRGAADAVLALMSGLAEGESDDGRA